MKSPLNKTDAQTAKNWVQGACLRTIRGVTAAILPDNEELQIYLKLDDNSAVVMGQPQIDKLDADIQNIKKMYAQHLQSLRN